MHRNASVSLRCEVSPQINPVCLLSFARSFDSTYSDAKCQIKPEYIHQPTPQKKGRNDNIQNPSSEHALLLSLLQTDTENSEFLFRISDRLHNYQKLWAYDCISQEGERKGGKTRKTRACLSFSPLLASRGECLALGRYQRDDTKAR